MRIRTAAATLCLLLVTIPAPQALAQDMPQECKDALELRSPQAQIESLTRCLEAGRLSGDNRATTFKQRAVAYMHLGRVQFALDDINDAIKLKPEDADNFYLRGFAYRALGQHERSIEDSSRAIGMDSKFAAAYANRAFSHKALGNDRQARSDAQRAKALDPTVKVPWF